jgi:hypothetical protein
MSKRASISLMAALLLGVGCAAQESSSDPAPAAGTTTDPVAALDQTGVVHASLSLGKEHAVLFVEFKPGLNGVVEVGRANVDTPALPTEPGPRNWIDTYHRLAGNDAPVPSSMLEAEARATALPAPVGFTPAPASFSESGDGPRFYNAGEQTWFNNTYCNGAQNCVQAWDWGVVTSHWKIGNGTGYAMVGSEGTVNATFYMWWEDCESFGPFGLFGSDCIWPELWQGFVVPGHWVSIDVNGNGNYIQWSLSGAGANTQISLAAHYN